MKFIHKFNNSRWRYNRWYDTKYTLLYLGVLFGTQQRTITLIHSIINPIISTKLQIIRAYYTTSSKMIPSLHNTVSHRDSRSLVRRARLHYGNNYSSFMITGLSNLRNPKTSVMNSK